MKLKVLLSMIGLILALTTLEIALRITEKQKYDYTPCQSLDNNFHHVMIPNTTCRYKTEEWDVWYKINNYGQRDNDVKKEKSENEFRVLLLGDSFTQGHGVDIEKSYAKQIEKRLAEKFTDKKITVINSGVFAWSPLVQYLYLKKEGLQFQPDLVITAFTITDFWDDRQRFAELKTSYHQLSDDQLKEKITNAEAQFDFSRINTVNSPQLAQASKNSERVFIIKSWLRKNVRIYKNFVDYFKKRDPVVQQDAIFRGNIDKDIMAITRGKEISDEDWQKLWELPMFSIENIGKLLAQNNINYIVLAIPDAVEVSDQESPNRLRFGLPMNHVDPRGPFQNEMEKRLEEKNIPFINILEDFQKSGRFPLYFSQDMHWNEAGQMLGGEVISQKLEPYLEKYLNKQTSNKF